MPYSSDPLRVNQRTTAEVKTPPPTTNSLYPKSDNQWYSKDSAGVETALGAPSGSLTLFAGGAAPNGWLLCQGQAISRTTYAGLFAAIGTTYGVGDGSTTFNLPNLQDRFPIGSSGTKALGATGGAATKTLVEANLPSHTHSMAHTHAIDHDHGSTSTASDGSHNHVSHRGGAAGNGSFFMRSTTENVANTGPLDADGSHTHTVDLPNFTGTSGASSAANTGATGSGTAVDVMNPWLALNFIIKT